MKNLYVLHTAKPGGAAESLKVLLAQWKNAEYQIEPLVALPKGQIFDELQQAGWPVFALPAGLEKRPLGTRGTMMALGKVLLQQRGLIKIIRDEKIDLVHANSTAAHAASGAAARRCGVPAIWHVRDLTLLGRWSGLLERQADAIVAISKTVAQSLEKQKIPHHKIHQIYNSLDVSDWPLQSPPDADILKILNASDSTVVFGCVGQLVPWKNQAMFIEAAALLRGLESHANIKFAIIGSDPWQQDSPYRRQLIAQAKTLGLGNELIFFPHQNDNRGALSACDVLVHPARCEPFGRVLIEAMALEKTVVAFDAAGAGEILTNEKDGLLISPESGSAGLVQAMRKVLLSSSLREKLGKAGSLTVQQRFNATDGTAQMTKLYESLI
ncbi:MAG: glycosyltransferase family 4 protein [Abditibacteriaceae bacterium]